MLITAAAVHQSSAGIGKKRGASTANGILQRFEIQLAIKEEISQHESCCSTSQQLEIITNPSETEPIVRCPCCRSTQVKLICVNCLCTNVLRIGRIKDELRRLQQSKIAVCNLIENVLVEEVKFESDHQQLKRSIENLKIKIAWKKEQVGLLRQRIANMEGQSERNHRNVVLLEKKMVSHAQRIQRTHLRIEEFRGINLNAKIKLAEQIAQISKSLLQIFRLEKRQLFSAGDQLPTVWTGQSKMHHRAAYLLNNFLCLDRSTLLSKAFAHTNPAETNQQFAQLPSPSSLQPNFPHDSLAALTFAAQLAQMFAHLFHFHLPYPQLHKTIMLLPTAGGLLIPQESAMRQAMFKLDFSCLHLCLSQGISPEECELTEPLANLHSLVTRILAGKMMDCVPRLDQRLLRQICEQFTAVQPDGRVLSEFTLDNVENDWVKVHCSS